MTALRPITAGILLTYLEHDAPSRLRSYFDSGDFTGGRFERFAGGGDRAGVADQFTSDDLVAVSLLGVRIPGLAALELLERTSKRLNGLLGEIPAEVDLWDVEQGVIGPGSAADALWNELVALPGVGWVAASKLLARKRPRLLPVYDRVVRTALGRSDEDSFWLPLQDVLLSNPELVETLRRVRNEAALGDEVSLLRTLDVSIWMREYGRPEPVPDAES